MVRRAPTGAPLIAGLLAAIFTAPGCAGTVPDADETVPPVPPPPAAAPAESPAARPLTAPGRTPSAPPLARGESPMPAPFVAGPHGEILRVGTRVVTTADLGDFVLRWEPDTAASALRRLRLEALVELEAAREGVTVDPALVDAAAAKAVDERVRRLRLEYGAAADVEAVLRERYGRTLASLRDDFRRAVRIDLLRARLTRLEEMRRDGVDLRVLVLPDEASALAAAGQWREGADGALLARKFGVRPPAAPPAVAIEDVPEAPLRARLAAAAAGEVLAPAAFEAADPERSGETCTWWQVFKVVRSWKGTAAPWTEVAAEVERSLEGAPASEEEQGLWELRAGARAGVSEDRPAKGFGPSAPPGTMRDR